MDLKYLTVLAHFNALVYCNHYLCKIFQIQSLVQYLEEKKNNPKNGSELFLILPGLQHWGFILQDIKDFKVQVFVKPYIYSVICKVETQTHKNKTSRDSFLMEC